MNHSIRAYLLFCFISISYCLTAQNSDNSREIWLDYLDKVAEPVFSNLAEDNLKSIMTVELSPTIDNPDRRREVAYLEAFGRTLSGIGPWLNSEGGSEREIEMRKKYRDWTLKAVKNSVDPDANDYMVWNGYQPLVDASFFALGLIRCPWIWENLDEKSRELVIDALLITRETVPFYSNWLLFSGVIEAMFNKYGLPFDKMRIDYGINQFAHHWYIGDGTFNDGNHFAMDYYNSYVIQPYLNAICSTLNPEDWRYKSAIEKFEKIFIRYAEIQERTIGHDGTYPVYGRSVVYRSGAFQHLADMALREKLPESLSPAQVREALEAVIVQTLGANNTFNEKGWLNLGVHGNQPSLADSYINTGSLYLCANVFLPLGLSPDHEFWTYPPEPWSSKKIWSGKDTPVNHKIN